MSTNSTIEWTATVHPDGSVTPGSTWNPVRGCTKVSPGCAHCYAETFAERFRGVKGHPYEQGFDLRLVPEKLTEPLTWKQPRRVFVNSMSDLFQEGVPFEYIDQAFAVMFLAGRHTFQILTKRADRMRDYIRSRSQCDPGYAALWTEQGPSESDGISTGNKYLVPWPLPNVWLGVSVENQHFADERIPLLLQTPAAIRFISAEPLLEAVDLRGGLGFAYDDSATGESIPVPALDWIIVGGESGPKARPFDLAWARSIVKQCADAGVACFVKQLGAKPRITADVDGEFVDDLRLFDKKGGDMAEWPPDVRIRQFPLPPVPQETP